MVTRHGRATPLIWRTVEKDSLKNNRNVRQDVVLQRLRDALPEGVHVTILVDRGVGNQKLFNYLEHELGFDYVIRFRKNTYVTTAKGERQRASKCMGKAAELKHCARQR